ncbi:MoxR family ATPase [Pseudogracilibacillus sp. SE30717A]|uniref:AAA family ATPase n=1 Tax=Pseudogracilibacillus sp. SE30717A TaxID=3098293 RepID=UPI00300DF33B
MNGIKLDEFLFEMNKVVIGRKEEFKLLFAALLTEGHVLFEDLPGTGKTTMMKAFAHGLASEFSRIQCTPDLLPTDVLGGSIFNPKTNDFYIRKGPVFTNVLLVDEINRALPRTQSSLLECMEEKQVTIEGDTYRLDAPFIVLATQNPVDMEGTFPLPEAQMDRFLMKINLGYPSKEEETQMLLQVGDDIPFEAISSVLDPAKIKQLQKEVKQVTVHESILQYMTTLAQQTRNHPLISIGVSPRGTKALYKTVKAWALLNGRDYVVPEDVKEMIQPVWTHRITLSPEARMSKRNSSDILKEIAKNEPIPEEEVIRL